MNEPTAKEKKRWSQPTLTKLGDLAALVQTGGNKSGPCKEGEGQGSGEEAMSEVGTCPS